MKRLLAVLSSIIAITSMLGAAPQATIMVRPSAETAAANAIIADMAAVQCADKSLAQKIGGIQVCTSPLPGKTRVVTKDQFLVALRREGIGSNVVDLLCPTEVSLKRTAAVVTGQTLFDTVKQFILSNSSFPGKVYIEPNLLQHDQEIPVGSVEVSVRPGTKSLNKGQVSIPVDISIDGVLYRTISVGAVVKLIAPVLIAKKSINRNDELNETNTSFEERDVTNMPSDVLYKSEMADNQTASLCISEGSVIRKSMVSTPVAVKSGESITVLVESRSVRISEKGTAVQDGRVGEIIKIRFTKDGREIRGRVAEPGLVKIVIL